MGLVADTIRASTLIGYAELARSVGLDPLRMLDSVGIPRTALTTPDLRISTTAVRDLLEQSGSAAEDFGLRLSELRSPSIMGPVALLLREQPTLRSAIEALIRYVSLHSAANHLSIEEIEDMVILRAVMTYPSPGPCRQATELGSAGSRFSTLPWRRRPSRAIRPCIAQVPGHPSPAPRSERRLRPAVQHDNLQPRGPRGSQSQFRS